MTDKELANKVVALGVGKANQIYPDALGRFYQIDIDADWQTSVNESKFVRDWRVAGALMESFQAVFIEKLIENPPKYLHGLKVWAVRSDLSYGNRSREWFENESLPRAIIEACVAALSEDGK